MLDEMIIHNHKIKVKGIKKKVIYHFSDLHLSEFDELSDENEKQMAIEQTEYWKNMRLNFANGHGEECSEKYQKSVKKHLHNLMKIANEGDALVIAGDLNNYINGANLRLIDSELEKLTVPYISVCGNHDRAENIPDGFIFSKTKESFQILELEDIVIVGLDDSFRSISAKQNDALKEVLKGKKPVIIAMHMPLNPEIPGSNVEKCGEYFYLNNNEASSDTLEFVKILKNVADAICNI